MIFTGDMWCDLKNNINAYADDSTLYATIKSPTHRLAVAESLNEDLHKIESCKSTSVVVSRSTPIFNHKWKFIGNG